MELSDPKEPEMKSWEVHMFAGGHRDTSLLRDASFECLALCSALLFPERTPTFMEAHPLAATGSLVPDPPAPIIRLLASASAYKDKKLTYPCTALTLDLTFLVHRG